MIKKHCCVPPILVNFLQGQGHGICFLWDIKEFNYGELGFQWSNTKPTLLHKGSQNFARKSLKKEATTVGTFSFSWGPARQTAHGALSYWPRSTSRHLTTHLIHLTQLRATYSVL